ncbi:hypothetical protein [Acetobacter sp. UBA5411]|uniref:hypothetical protein n=1 Tax=Acetobacter sp. UBA5411 TaxID=1945905 RepID=UPI0025C2BEE2|nr:hypothetical protein [Acetobacter sp. UBA5411]
MKSLNLHVLLRQQVERAPVVALQFVVASFQVCVFVTQSGIVRDETDYVVLRQFGEGGF